VPSLKISPLESAHIPKCCIQRRYQKFGWGQGLRKAGSGGGQLTPKKFGADVRNCIWRVRQTGFNQSNGNDHLSNNQHDFKGWGENQRIMLRDKT